MLDTFVEIDDSETCYPFSGLAELQAIIKKKQDKLRAFILEEGGNTPYTLLGSVQVTISDEDYTNVGIVTYDLDGDFITGIGYQSEGVESLLEQCGLPVFAGGMVR